MIKDVVVGVTGASVAQVISFLLVPIVARLFSPADFGGAALFLGVFALMSSVASMRYEQAIVLPESEEKAKALTCVSLRILAGVILVSVALVLILILLPIYNEYNLVLWAILLPLFLLIAGGSNILISWSTRLGQFSHMASADVTSTMGTSGSRIGIGLLFGSSVIGLLLGNLIGYGVRAFVLWSGVRKNVQKMGSPCRLPPGVMPKVVSEYRDFPLYSAPTGFIREFKENIPLFGIVLLFSAQAAGFYAMAIRIVRLPVAVVSMPVRRVFIQRASQAVNNGHGIKRLLIKITGMLLVTGAPPFFLIFQYGSELFSWLLGSNWENAGKYAEIIAVWLLSIFTLTPAAAAFIVTRKQHIWMLFQVGGAFFGILAFVLSNLLSLSIQDSLKLFVLVQIILNIAIFLVALYVSPGEASNGKAASEYGMS